MDNMEKQEMIDNIKKKRKRKINWSWIYIGVTVLIMLLFGVFGNQFKDVFKTISNLTPGFLSLAFLTLLAYIILESIIIRFMMKSQGILIGYLDSLKVGIIGLYYSAITPSSTGGQPAQSAYLYRDNFKKIETSKQKDGVTSRLYRDKVPPGKSTAVLLMKFFCFQVAFEICALISFIFIYDTLEVQTGYMIPFIVLGLIINGLSCLFFSSLFYRPFFARLCRAVKWIANKFKFLRNNPNVNISIDRFEKDFGSYTDNFNKKIGSIVLGIVLSFPEFILQMSVIYFVFRAFGYKDMPYFEVFMIQAVLQSAVSFMPMPGASGAQELAFTSLFAPYFTNNDLYFGVMVWRFITYYLIVIGGGILVVADTALYGRKKAKMEPKKANMINEKSEG